MSAFIGPFCALPMQDPILAWKHNPTTTSAHTARQTTKRVNEDHRVVGAKMTAAKATTTHSGHAPHRPASTTTMYSSSASLASAASSANSSPSGSRPHSSSHSSNYSASTAASSTSRLSSPPTPSSLHIELLCVPYDLAPDALPAPQTHVSLPKTLTQTTVSDVCSYALRCPAFRPYLNALQMKNQELRISLCLAQPRVVGGRGMDCGRRLRSGMPGVHASTEELTLDMVGVGGGGGGNVGGAADGGNRVWCLVEVDHPKKTKRSRESLVDGLKTAFKKSDFRFGGMMKFGNAGKIGILNTV
ncbi:hypothetical protein BDZ88DRAFT_483826 [Geranomyces variabilis]|nr:hypothetical protein BDZ88DRAFT_483826 [Geranomyces variabilis]KAJ3131920.1 hypothetical protein HDU90_007667 [Geranomyces variabilis]